MSERILRLKPEEVAKLFAEGKMEVVNDIPPATSKEPQLSSDSMIERARNLLGKDFLGVEAVRNMESKLRGVGVDVMFSTWWTFKFPYSERDLQLAKQNGEMLVLRASILSGSSDKPPSALSITLNNFRGLFNKYAQRGNPLFDDWWYKDEKFASQPYEIKDSWSLVKKISLDRSNTSWTTQELLLQEYEESLKQNGAKNVSLRRRTALEVFYDTLLYYVNTGEKLLTNTYDWGNSATSRVNHSFVGGFGPSGIRIDEGSTEHPVQHGINFGLFPTR